jgi:hypothetical protein
MIGQARSNHAPYLALALILHLFLVVSVAYVNDWYDPPFSVGNDLNLHVPYALKLADPRLYSRDPDIGWFGTGVRMRLEQWLFPALLSVLFAVLGGIRPTLIVLSLFLGIVFVIGMYALSFTLSRDPLAGIISAFPASFSYWALSEVSLGFSPAHVLPRNFVVATSPGLLALYLRWRNRKALWVLYALLGLAANVHILAALHIVLILTLSTFLSSRISWSLLARMSVAAIVCLACALPAVMAFLPTLRDVVMVTPEEARAEVARYASVLRPSLAGLLAFAIAFSPFAVLGTLGFRLAHRQAGARWSTWHLYLTTCSIVALLPWVGVLINAYTLSLRQLELLRITRYYYAMSFAPVSALLSHWLRERGRSWVVLASVSLVLTIILSRPQIGWKLGSEGAKLLGPAQETPAENDADLDRLRVGWDWEAFSDLCRWVEASTPVNALFVAPPEWGPFRTYARRGMVTSWKGSGAPERREAYVAVLELYRHPRSEGFSEIARLYDADYAIVAAEFSLPDMDLVFRNDRYAIYQVPES